jgi:phenylalanyl-tRNA synthetase beta chain
MKFLYKDLLNFLSEKPSKELLSEKLFQLGHEHEIAGDIFDMELTPNRGDCLSLNGLARDLNVFFGKVQPYKIYEGDILSLDFNFKNLSTDACPKISFLEIEIEGSIAAYKPYLENYFSLLGNNKVNFFTDVSNYISYELGQPTHCFDSSTINNQLTFENKICQESFNTLMGSNINLEGKNCIFSVNNKIISLAGVMGGKSTACSSQTRKALIECAYFKPEEIIGKSVKYNLVSDAAHKFERGVDIQGQEKVLRRFIAIVQDHVAIKNFKIQTFDDTEIEQSRIPIDLEKVNKILGIDIEKEQHLMILNKLGFEINNNELNTPSYRHDISSQNDLAEEIARVLGYDSIKSEPLEIKNNLNENINHIYKVKNFLVQNGFSEVVNFPFTSIKDKKSITIDNPLDSNKSQLRTSLKSSLLENLQYNERRQNDSIKLFEISDLYSRADQINQERKLGLIISGRRGHNYADFSKKLDFNYLNQILNEGANQNIFTIEEISRADLKTKKKDKIFYTEVLIENIPADIYKDYKLNEEQINFIKYQPVSEFPSSVRDFSFCIVDFKKYNMVIKLISNLDDDILKHAYIFDFYENKKIKEIKVGVRLIFQSVLCTLSDEEIQKTIERLLKPILDLEGVSVPGL